MSTDLLTVPSNDEKNIATITHLGGILFSFIPALIVFLLKKDDSEFIRVQAREALNFQITLLLAQFVAYVLIFVLVGFLLLGLIWLFNIVICIIAAISSSKGEHYHYPFTLRLIN
ncbi:MAG: hypothetical protein B7Y16_03890 [Methylotenera sp. 24-45-7]|jgi:uncharacterized Tic20 family protein|nr:MAG: hypothetical protein B7Y16_03890 [Methylotenera sp. 24-45-7]OZA08204.1 MAG: hypothetical protein B7X97_07090 [Methylotenera sp. 17-45-7]OZA53936.1 MAG: hypothetical protein B7X73_02670 [Methylophilales bacterium 39-45-7]HQS37423.1 DUF4870 domain-containing protein [Methylotenera sp.]HQS43774.1 DUF4870 domain-containing protein [Methylotenera sp.]